MVCAVGAAVRGAISSSPRVPAGRISTREGTASISAAASWHCRLPVGRESRPNAAILVGHLGQVFDVDVQVAGIVGLEAAMRGLGLLRLQRLQVAHAVAPEAAVEPRAGDMRVEELAHHGKQIVERQEKRLAQRHRDVLRYDRSTGSIVSRSNPAPVSASSASDAACGSGRERRRDPATSRPSARRSRSAWPPSRPGPCSPESQPVS